MNRKYMRVESDLWPMVPFVTARGRGWIAAAIAEKSKDEIKEIRSWCDHLLQRKGDRPIVQRRAKSSG